MSISSFLTKKFLKSLFFPAHNRGTALPKKLVKLLKNQPGFWDLPELPEIGSPLSKSGLVSKSQKELSKKFKAKGPHQRYMEVQGNIQNQLMKKEEMLARQQREQRAEAIRAKYNLPKNS